MLPFTLRPSRNMLAKRIRNLDLIWPILSGVKHPKDIYSHFIKLIDYYMSMTTGSFSYNDVAHVWSPSMTRPFIGSVNRGTMPRETKKPW